MVRPTPACLQAPFSRPSSVHTGCASRSGQDQASVDDPKGAGLGRVACAEAQFEIKFTKVEIRVQAGLAEAAADVNYQFQNTLAIGVPAANGNYPAMNRLPTFTPPATYETMRLRIPVARNQGKSDPLDQDEGAAPKYAIGTKYMEKGSTRFKVDEKLYSRPEIPIEFVLKLTSRDTATNPDGLVQADAVGAAIIEPVAEEYISPAVLAAGGVNERYWRNAAFKVKKGDHRAPWHNANNGPEFTYWMARLEVVNDGEQDFDVTTFDNTLGYLAASKELTVYLNRTLLTFSDRTAIMTWTSRRRIIVKSPEALLPRKSAYVRISRKPAISCDRSRRFQSVRIRQGKEME